MGNGCSEKTGLDEVLNKYTDINIYPVNKKDKKGNSYMGMAFYYDDMNGKKHRIARQGTSVEELWEKRRQFLTDLYHQILEKKKLTRQAELIPSIVPVQHYAPTSISTLSACNKTLSEAIEEFMAVYKEQDLAGATIEAEESNNNTFRNYLGDKLVTAITFNDYQHMINQIAKGKDNKPAARKTLMNKKTSFTRIMRYCMKQKWISYEDFTLITTDIKIPSYTKIYDKNEKFLEYSEIGEVLRVLKHNPKFYITSRILFLTGMRQEEFYALEKTDLYRDEQYINVTKAMVKNKQKGKGQRLFILGPTKNPQSVRKVPAIPEVFDLFDELEQWMVSSGNRRKATARNNGNFIITDRNGNLLDEHSFITNLRIYIEKYTTVNFTLGMARHCYQTHLDDLDAGKSDVDLAVGHVLTNVSDKYYRATRNAYMKRLYPCMITMAEQIEHAYQNKE